MWLLEAAPSDSSIALSRDHPLVPKEPASGIMTDEPSSLRKLSLDPAEGDLTPVNAPPVPSFIRSHF